jgi:ribonuclease III
LILGIFPLFRKTISKEDQRIIEFIKNHFGFKPKSLKLFKKALIHKSTANNRLKDTNFNNERLEFLGDSVLDAIIAAELYSKYLNHKEGDLTKFKAKVVNRSTLNKIANAINIADLLQTEVVKNAQNNHMVGNALEALIGAIFIDKGYDFTNKTVLRLFEKHINLQNLELIENDFKSKLLEYAQKNKHSIRFEINPIGELEHQKQYTATVFLDDKELGIGKGHRKKKAEQLAAEEAVKNWHLFSIKTI